MNHNGVNIEEVKNSIGEENGVEEEKDSGHHWEEISQDCGKEDGVTTEGMEDVANPTHIIFFLN